MATCRSTGTRHDDDRTIAGPSAKDAHGREQPITNACGPWTIRPFDDRSDRWRRARLGKRHTRNALLPLIVRTPALDQGILGASKRIVVRKRKNEHTAMRRCRLRQFVLQLLRRIRNLSRIAAHLA